MTETRTGGPRRSEAAGRSPTGSRRAPVRPRSRAWIPWLLGIVFVTLVAYVPCLDNDFTNWDDPLFVYRNSLVLKPDIVRTLTTPVANNYHPITIWSLAVNHWISGIHPSSYHWLNLLFHLANTALVFLFVRRLSKDRFWTTVITSLFFGIHPMHVESVAWIAERKDVVYAFFYLLGLIAYLRYLDERKTAWLGATFAAFVLSIASKPSAVVLPVTLFAIDWFRRRPFAPRVCLEKVPFFAISIVAGLLTIHAQRVTGAIDTQTWSPSFQKLAFASYGIMMYVVKLLVPAGLSAIYPYPPPGPLPWDFLLTSALVLIGLPTVLFVFRHQRAILFGIAFFFINIALVLQVFTVGQAIFADRYTYLPYVGLFFALAWGLDRETGTAREAGPARGQPNWRSAALGGFVLLGLFSLVQTWRRCDVWQNSETLWNDTIRRYPHRIAYSYYNRGHYYYQSARRFDDALADFSEAIRIDPKDPNPYVMKGNLYGDLGKIDSALVAYDQAIRVRPNAQNALNNRSVLRLRKGDVQGAVSDAERAVAIDPSYRDGYCNLALAYSSQGQFEKSIAASRRAIELDPTHPENHIQYASIGLQLERLKRDREAIQALDEAIRLSLHGDTKAGGYFVLRSYAKLSLGDRAGAIHDVREALRFGVPVDPAYLKELGMTPETPGGS